MKLIPVVVAVFALAALAGYWPSGSVTNAAPVNVQSGEKPAGVQDLQLTIEPLKKAFVVGEPIPAKWTIKNVSALDQSIVWDKSYHKSYMQYLLNVGAKDRAMALHCIAYPHLDSRPPVLERVVLKPGESRSMEINLRNFYANIVTGSIADDYRLGVYQVAAVYDPKLGAALCDQFKLDLSKPEFAGAVVARIDSPTVEIEIVPAGPPWTEVVNGIQARIAIEGYVAKLVGMEVDLEVEQVSGEGFTGELAPLSWKVTDAAGAEIKPKEVQQREPKIWQGKSAWLWQGKESRIGMGQTVGPRERNLNGHLEVGPYQWELKPGHYSLQGVVGLRPKQTAKPAGPQPWTKQIKLPAVAFEVIGEVSDEELTAAAKRVRAAHPAGGEAMWKALAELLRPSTPARQLKLVLPPAEGEMPGAIFQEGNNQWESYPLDDLFEAKVSLYYVIQDKPVAGEDPWVLSGPPEIARRVEPGPRTIPGVKLTP